MKDLVGPTHMAGSGKTSLIEPSIVSYSTIISIGLNLDPSSQPDLLISHLCCSIIPPLISLQKHRQKFTKNNTPATSNLQHPVTCIWVFWDSFPFLTMIPGFGRSEVVTIYPGMWLAICDLQQLSASFTLETSGNSEAQDSPRNVG